MPDEIGKKGKITDTDSSQRLESFAAHALSLSVAVVQDALEDRMKEISESIEYAAHDIVKIRLQQRLYALVSAYDEVTDLL